MAVKKKRSIDRSRRICFTRDTARAYVRRIVALPGWSQSRLDCVIAQQFGIESSSPPSKGKKKGGRFRFCNPLLTQEQRVNLPGSLFTFYDVMEWLFKVPEFAALATQWYRPVFSLVDRFPLGLIDLEPRIQEALARTGYTRMNCQRLREGLLARPTISLFLPFHFKDLELNGMYGRSLASMAHSPICVLDRLNLVALLYCEAVIENRHAEAGSLNEIAHTLLEEVGSTTLLKKTHLAEFVEEFRYRILVRVDTIKTCAQKNGITVDDVVGSPLLTPNEVPRLERDRLRAIRLNPEHCNIARAGKQVPPLGSRDWLKQLGKFHATLAESSALLNGRLYGNDRL